MICCFNYIYADICDQLNACNYGQDADSFYADFGGNDVQGCLDAITTCPFLRLMFNR